MECRGKGRGKVLRKKMEIRDEEIDGSKKRRKEGSKDE